MSTAVSDSALSGGDGSPPRPERKTGQSAPTPGATRNSIFCFPSQPLEGAKTEGGGRERRLSLLSAGVVDGRRSTLTSGFPSLATRRKTVDHSNHETHESMEKLKGLFIPIVLRRLLARRKHLRWPGDVPPRDYTVESIVAAIKSSNSQLARWPEELLGLLASDSVVRYLEPDDPIVYLGESHLSAGIVVLLHGKLVEKRRDTPLNKTLIPSHRPMNSKKTRTHEAPAMLCDDVILVEDVTSSHVQADGYADVAVISSRWFWSVINSNATTALTPAQIDQFRAYVLPNRQQLLLGPYFPTSLVMRRTWLWEFLSKSERNKLARSMTPSVFLAGDVVCTEGTKNPFLYILRRGSLLVTRNGTPLSYFDVGTSFGEVSVLLNDVRNTTVTASTICELYAVHRKSLLKLMHKNEKLRNSLIAAVVSRRKQWLEEAKDRTILGLAAALANVPCLSHTNDTMRTTLANASVIHMFSPGEAIVKEGTRCQHLFIIGRGQVQVTREAPGKATDGKVPEPFTPVKLSTGDFFGEFALFPHTWPHSVTCASDAGCDVWVLPATEIIEVLEKDMADVQAIELCRQGIQLYKAQHGGIMDEFGPVGPPSRDGPTPSNKSGGRKRVGDPQLNNDATSASRRRSRKVSLYSSGLPAGATNRRASSVPHPTRAQRQSVVQEQPEEIPLVPHTSEELCETWRERIMGAVQGDDGTAEATMTTVVDNTTVSSNSEPRTDGVQRETCEEDFQVEAALIGKVDDLFSVPHGSGPHAADCDFPAEPSDIQQAVVEQVLLTTTKRQPKLLYLISQSDATVVAGLDNGDYEDTHVSASSFAFEDTDSPLYMPPPKAIHELGDSESSEEDQLYSARPTPMRNSVAGSVYATPTSFAFSRRSVSNHPRTSSFASGLSSRDGDSDSEFGVFRTQETDASEGNGMFDIAASRSPFETPDRKPSLSPSRRPPLGTSPATPSAWNASGGCNTSFSGLATGLPRLGVRPSSAASNVSGARRSRVVASAKERRGTAHQPGGSRLSLFGSNQQVPGGTTSSSFADTSPARSNVWSAVNKVNVSRRTRMVSVTQSSALDRYVKLEDQNYFEDCVKVMPLNQGELVVGKDFLEGSIGSMSDLGGVPILLLMHVRDCMHLSGLRKLKRPIVKVATSSRVLIRTPVMDDSRNPTWPIETASFITFIRRSQDLHFTVCDAENEEREVYSADLIASELPENSGVGLRTFALTDLRENKGGNDDPLHSPDASARKNGSSEKTDNTLKAKKRNGALLTVCLLAVTASKYKPLKGIVSDMNEDGTRHHRNNSTTQPHINASSSHKDASVIHLQILGVESLRHRIEAVVKVNITEDGKVTSVMETPQLFPKTRTPTWPGDTANCHIASDGVINFELCDGSQLVATCDVSADALAFDGVGIHRLPLLKVSQDNGNGAVVGILHVSVLQVTLPTKNESVPSNNKSAIFVYIERASVSSATSGRKDTVAGRGGSAGSAPDLFVIAKAHDGMELLRTPTAMSSRVGRWEPSLASCFVSPPNLTEGATNTYITAYDNDCSKPIGSAVLQLTTVGTPHPRFDLPLSNGQGQFRLQCKLLPVEDLSPKPARHSVHSPLSSTQRSMSCTMEAQEETPYVVMVHVSGCDDLAGTDFDGFQIDPLVRVRSGKRCLLVTPTVSSSTAPRWPTETASCCIAISSMDASRNLTFEVYDGTTDEEDLIGTARVQFPTICRTSQHYFPLVGPHERRAPPGAKHKPRKHGTILVETYIGMLDSQVIPAGAIMQPLFQECGVDAPSGDDSDDEKPISSVRVHVSCCTGVTPHDFKTHLRVTASAPSRSTTPLLITTPVLNTSNPAWEIVEANFTLKVEKYALGDTLEFLVESQTMGGHDSAKRKEKAGDGNAVEKESTGYTSVDDFVLVGKSTVTLKDLLDHLVPDSVRVMTLSVHHHEPEKSKKQKETPLTKSPQGGSVTSSSRASESRDITLTLTVRGSV